MPRLLQTTKARRIDYAKLPGLCKALADGNYFSFLDGNILGYEPSKYIFQEAWVQLRDVILSSWVAEHPGSRPWGWWMFDRPELRRRIDGQVHPFDDPGYCAKAKRIRAEHPHGGLDLMATSYGIPRYHTTEHVDRDGLYETEAAYLDRLGLLADDERNAVEATASRTCLI